jgi:FtsZ-binding cell division protein ZapB
MTKKQIINNILRAKEIDFNRFAMECGILPNTLVIAMNRKAFSNGIINKICTRFNVREQYLKDGKGEIFEENGKILSNGSNGKMQVAKVTEDFKTIDKVIDALERYRLLETESLKEKHKWIVEELNDQVKGLQDKINKLEKEKAEIEKDKAEWLKKLSSHK